MISNREFAASMGSYIVINSKKTPAIEAPGIPVFKTERAGHAVEIIRGLCLKDPAAEIHVWGGDGSVFEAVNAVLSSGHADTVVLVIHPFGTGNDFARNFPLRKDFPGEPNRIDLLRFGSRCAANEINLGFDCDVVSLTHKIKRFPLFRGSFAYMIGVLLTLFRPLGRRFDLTVTGEDGEEEELHGCFLLCLAANGGYYGGGFHCAPRARLDDGLIEFFWVDKISRLKFLAFFLGYRKGKHLNANGTVCRKYSSFLHYKRAKAVRFENAGTLCADGEIFHEKEIVISPIEKALSVQVMR